MTSKCETCGDPLGDKFIVCDSCHISMHPTEGCTGLGASELRAVVIQKRTLVYFCEDCRKAFKSVPNLLRQIDSLRSEVNSLKDEVRRLKDSKNDTPINSEDIICELHERQKRANNLLIFNLPESNNVSDDLIQVKTLITKAAGGNITDIDDTKVFRFGKKNKNGRRPIKVALKSPRDVHAVIKNKQNISREDKIYIYLDQTPNQRKTLETIRGELSRRQLAGEQNLTIKYINNNPVIITKN